MRTICQCNPLFEEKRRHSFDSKGHRIFPGTIRPRLYVTPPSHRASVGVVPSQVELSVKLVPSPLPWKCGACRLDTMEHRECASIDATPAILDKSNCSFLIQPAVAERPATPLSTRHTWPGGNSILLILYPLSSADRPGIPHQQDGSFLVFENSSLNHILQVSSSHLWLLNGYMCLPARVRSSKLTDQKGSSLRKRSPADPLR